MKTLFFVLSLFLLVSFAQAVSIEQIAKLAELKTKDDLILQLVQREGLDRPLTTDDVIMLREKGASERVIDYLLKLTPSTTAAPQKQEGESVWIEKNIRAYHSRDKKGKPILVVTNLDEHGKRMGPPPEPTPEEVYVPEEQPQPVQEVHVTVTHEQPEPPPYDDEYPEEPPPPYYDSGMPYYPGGYYPAGGYYPYVDPGSNLVNPHCARPYPAGRFQPIRTQGRNFQPRGGNFQPRIGNAAPRAASAMQPARGGMGFRPR